MPSKRLEEILQSMPPESRAAIEKITAKDQAQIIQNGQVLDKRGIAEKSEYMESGRRAAQTRTSEPADQMPKHQPERRIDRAIAEKDAAKTAEPSKTQEKAPPAKEPER